MGAGIFARKSNDMEVPMFGVIHALKKLRIKEYLDLRKASIFFLYTCQIGSTDDISRKAI